MLVERILLSGGLLLIPTSLSFFRLLAALFISALTSVLLLLTMPYKQAVHDYLAVAIHIALWVVFTGCLCFKLHDDMRDAALLDLTEINLPLLILGFKNANVFLNVSLGVTFSALVVVLFALMQQLISETRVPNARMSGGTIPELSMAQAKHYHCFLSRKQ